MYAETLQMQKQYISEEWHFNILHFLAEQYTKIMYIYSIMYIYWNCIISLKCS